MAGRLPDSAQSSQLLASLPILAFLLAWLILMNLPWEWAWRASLLRAAVLWGAYLALITELLSLFSAINRLGLVIAWGLPVLAMSGWLTSRVFRREFRLPPTNWDPRGFDWAVLGYIGFVIAVTGLVAWLTPPQTWDALTYRMARVAHWAQNETVRPFATGIEWQNSRPPYAEFEMLQSYVLIGGDRLATSVQWFSMLGSLAGVSLVAARLGLNRSVQLAAAAFAASLPMGVVQASSTMNDYVVTLWMVCVAAEAAALLAKQEDRWAPEFIALAGGLALATKPTAAAFLLPFGLLTAILLVRRLSLGRTLVTGVIGLALFASPSIGYLARNYEVYGAPLDPFDVAEHGGQPHTVPVLISNLVRNASLHAGTPSPHFNKLVALAIQRLHRVLRLDPSEPSTTAAGRFHVFPPSTNENLAGNPLHALLLAVAVGVFAFRRRELSNGSLVYAVTVLSTVFVFSLVFKWQVFGSRYHLPFFVLAAPLAGMLLAHPQARIWGKVVTVLLFAYAIPWLFQIRSRPLIPNPANAYVDSILKVPRSELYLAGGRYLEDPFNRMTMPITEAGCDRVGILISGNTPEYPLWVKLGAPEPGLRIEWLTGGSASARYAEEGFLPCAVICQSCPQDWETIRGLPRVLQYAGFQLYAAEG